MTVFLLDCVILSSSCPRKLLALRGVSFLALSVTMPPPLFFFCRLSLRYDMILITLRVTLSFFFSGLYLLYLLIGSSYWFRLWRSLDWYGSGTAICLIIYRSHLLCF